MLLSELLSENWSCVTLLLPESLQWSADSSRGKTDGKQPVNISSHFHKQIGASVMNIVKKKSTASLYIHTACPVLLCDIFMKSVLLLCGYITHWCNMVEPFEPSITPERTKTFKYRAFQIRFARLDPAVATKLIGRSFHKLTKSMQHKNMWKSRILNFCSVWISDKYLKYRLVFPHGFLLDDTLHNSKELSIIHDSWCWFRVIDDRMFNKMSIAASRQLGIEVLVKFMTQIKFGPLLHSLMKGIR